MGVFHVWKGRRAGYVCIKKTGTKLVNLLNEKAMLALTFFIISIFRKLSAVLRTRSYQF